MSSAPGRKLPSATVSQEDIDKAFEQSGYNLGTHVAHVIRRAHQRATTKFTEVMFDHDLTPTQMAALASMLRYGEMSQNQLGRHTSMDPSTVGIVVRKLLTKKFIEREISSEDMRVFNLRLTDKGKRYAISLLTLGQEIERRVLMPLNAEEQKSFRDLLARISDSD